MKRIALFSLCALMAIGKMRAAESNEMFKAGPVAHTVTTAAATAVVFQRVLSPYLGDRGALVAGGVLGAVASLGRKATIPSYSATRALPALAEKAGGAAAGAGLGWLITGSTNTKFLGICAAAGSLIPACAHDVANKVSPQQ